MVSLARTIRHARYLGLKEWYRSMWYIGDAKKGKLVGTDQFGNRYFENLDATEEVPGRHRWVDYAQHDYNATQVPRGWSSWLHHIRLLPPPEDKVMEACKQPWQVPYHENLTGTRGRFITYSTQAPKMSAWEPKVKPRA